MNLSRPDRRERLDRLAAEYALGTAPARVRRRLARLARRDIIIADALGAWERRIAVLADRVPGITPPPRVWRQIVTRLGLDHGPAAQPARWWQRVGLWRGFAVASFAVAVALGVSQLGRPPVPGEASMVVLLAGPDAKPVMIATAGRNDRFLTLKGVIDTSLAPDKALELWALPQGGTPVSLGLIPAGAVVKVPLDETAAQSLANVPALAVSLEPSGGSPTGQPTGPVLYSGKVERMY